MQVYHHLQPPLFFCRYFCPSPPYVVVYVHHYLSGWVIFFCLLCLWITQPYIVRDLYRHKRSKDFSLDRNIFSAEFNGVSPVNRMVAALHTALILHSCYKTFLSSAVVISIRKASKICRCLEAR